MKKTRTLTDVKRKWQILAIKHIKDGNLKALKPILKKLHYNYKWHPKIYKYFETLKSEATVPEATKAIIQSILPEQRQSTLLELNPGLKPSSAILSLQRDPHSTSTKYVKTDDMAVLQALNQQGWKMINYVEQKRQKRNRHRIGFQKYRAVYVNDNSQFIVPDLGQLSIIQTGAHDGTTKQTLQIGFHSFISLHDIGLGTDLFSWDIKHRSEYPNHLHHIIDLALSKTPLAKAAIEQLNSKILTIPQSEAFAKEAIELRFEGKYNVDVNDVLKPLSKTDKGASIWKIYNRIHKNLLDPKFSVGVLDPKTKQPTGKERKASKMKSIIFIHNFNVRMWNLANKYNKLL